MESDASDAQNKYVTSAGQEQKIMNGEAEASTQRGIKTTSTNSEPDIEYPCESIKLEKREADGDVKRDDKETEDLFSSFLSEVEEMQSKKSHTGGVKKSMIQMLNSSNAQTERVPKKTNFGTADEEIARILKKKHTNPYDIFLLSPECEEEEIKKTYKKLSLIIHPDKTPNTRAQEAFQVVTKAYEEVQEPEYRSKYQKVIVEAKRRVLKMINANNKKLSKQKNHKLIPTDDQYIKEDVITMCEQMLEELEERNTYADRVRKANEEYEKRMEEEKEEAEKQEIKEKREWIRKQEGRVDKWREYKDNIENKRLKLSAFQPLSHKREERKTADKGMQHKPMGIDESYKQNWR